MKLKYILGVFSVSLSLISSAQNGTKYDHIIDTIITKTVDYYIFPEVAEQLKTTLSQLPANAFDGLSDEQFADTISSLLISESDDQHFGLLYRPGFLKNSDSQKDQQALFDEINRRWNLGFETVKRLPGNIGYIEYTGFAEPNSSQEALESAMLFVENTNSLILDVRNNSGGDGGMLLLFCSYFFDDHEVLSSAHYRYKDKTVLSKTKKRVSGKKYLDRPVYILTNSESFSAAESISYHLQARGIATIVGETTAGAANPVDLFVIDNDFLFFVPVGNISDRITGTNWEHTGVIPDYPISGDKALEKAQILALETILKNNVAAEISTEEIQQRIAYLNDQIGTSTSNADDKTRKIEAFLDSLEGFSGAVLIAKDDSVLFEKAYGYAHLGHEVKNTTSTRFSYASVGKSFTATAIFQLIEHGKISLNDPIGKFFPEYPNDIARDSISIELLLQHRSGLPNYFHSETFLQASKERYRNMHDLAELYENEPLEFSPGEQFAYRNTNYILLGRIIEKVSGMSYDDYLDTYIFSVADMPNTGNYDSDHPLEHSAENYIFSEVYPNQTQKAIFKSSVRGSAAGGGYSTVEDLFHFATAFKKNALLSPEFTNLMKQAPEDAYYGYGMQFAGAKGSGIYGHSGGHYGVGAEWRVFEKEGYTVILLTNKDLDQGFLDARFFIEKTISGSTPKLDRYFFTREVIRTCLADGIEAAKAKMNTSKVELSEMSLNAKGYELINRGFYKDAIDVLTLAVLAFPESYDAYDSLGEAYMKDGQVKNAIIYYQKSLELNSENANAAQQLKELIAIDKASN